MTDKPEFDPGIIGEKAKPTLWWSGLHTLGTSVISILLGIGSSILVARALGPANKGSSDLVLATGALLSNLLGFSLSAGIIYVTARGKAALGALARSLLPLFLLQGILASAVLGAAYPLRLNAAFLPERLGLWAFMAAILLVVITASNNSWRAMLVGSQHIIQVNRTDLSGKIFYAAALLLLAGWTYIAGRSLTPMLVVAANLAAALVSGGLMLRLLRPTFIASSAGDPAFSEMWAFALPSYLGNLAQFLNYRLDVFLVNYFSGVEAVGLYTLAVSLAQLLWLISNSAATVLLPKVASTQTSVAENAARTARVTRLVFWISVAAAVGLALVGKFLLPVLYGEAYRRSIAPLLLLLPGVTALTAGSVVSTYLSGIGKPHLNFYISLAGLVVTVIFDLLLIPRLGIAGAAITSTLSYSLNAILTIIIFVYLTKTAWRKVILPGKDDLEMLRTLASSFRTSSQRADDGR